jgi:DNA-binding response OmpR family regulator
MDLDFYVKPIELEHLVNHVRAELSSSKILEPPKILFCEGIRLNKVQQERSVY